MKVVEEVEVDDDIQPEEMEAQATLSTSMENTTPHLWKKMVPFIQLL